MREARKIALVTGATQGIGQLTATRLAKAEWTVLVHGRSATRAVDACDRIRRSVPTGSLHPVHADFSSLSEVRALASRVLADWPRLDALVNNAGVFTPNALADQRRLSADGYELMWAVNYLASFSITTWLLHALVSAGSASVVNVSSGMHLRASLHWDDLQHADRWDRVSAYGQSKLALTIFASELALRLRATGVRVNAVSPGYVDTRLVRNAFGGATMSPAEGARWVVQPLLAGSVSTVTGRYLDQGQTTAAHPLVSDQAARTRLWEVSEWQVDAVCGGHG